MSNPHIGKKCVIRTYASGVHFGELVSQDGRQVCLREARRLWLWKAIGGISLSEVACNGIDPDGSRIACPVPEMSVLDALEIIPATSTAAASIERAETAKPR